MLSVSVEEAQVDFERLLELVEGGETIHLCRDGVPIASLRPFHDPLKPHPELSKVIFHEDPSLPLTEEEWPERYR
jgi:antitoxin (DNA-binding transcriptional repressor) of toxin-antitoxin stability system